MTFSDHPFQWAGQEVGQLLRLIVEALAWGVTHIGRALVDFYEGLRQALGLSPSVGALCVFLIGLILLLVGLRALWRRHFVRAVIAGLPGIALLSWLIH